MGEHPGKHDLSVRFMKPGSRSGSLGWPLPQHKIIAEGGRALVESAGGIDESVFRREIRAQILGAPSAGGVEVLQAKPDGIDFAVALGALRFLLMEGDAFAGGERFARKPVELGDVGRGRRGRIMQEFAQDPRAAFDGAGLFTVAVHGEDGGHTQKPAPGRPLGEVYLAELVSYDPRDWRAGR